MIGEGDWCDFADIFEFQTDDHTTVAELPQHAQRYTRSLQRGRVTEAEKRAAVDAARQLQVARAQYQRAIDQGA